MSEIFLGMIILVPYNFAPLGFMDCAGQSLPISQNDALYALIGTTFGGDGVTTFNLPDLRGRTPIGTGTGTGLSNYILGQVGGVENVTLTANQMPNHSHGFLGDKEPGNTAKVKNNFLAEGYSIYKTPPPAPAATFAGGTTIGGGSLPHNNLQPYTTMRWVIAVEGIFPAQN